MAGRERTAHRMMHGVRLLMGIILLSMLFSLVHAQVAHAAGETSVRIDSFNSSAAVEASGEMAVEDTLHFSIEGAVEAVEYVIDKEAGTTLSHEAVRVSEWRDEGWVELEQDESGTRTGGFYSLSVGDATHQRIKIFPGGQTAQMALLVSYRIKDAAVRYDDFARLEHQFISRRLSYPVTAGSVRLTLPKSEQSMAYRFGAGEVDAVEPEHFTETLAADVGQVAPGEGMRLDVIFDAGAVSGSRRFEPGSVKPILDANDEVLRARKSALGLIGEWPILSWYVSAGLGLLAVAGLFYSIRHQRLSRAGSAAIHSPLSRSWLIERVVTPRGLNATLIDFMRRGVIDATNGAQGVWRLVPPTRPLPDGERMLYAYLERTASSGELSLSGIASADRQEKRTLMRQLDVALRHEGRASGYGNLLHALRWLLAIAAALFVWAAITTFRAPGLSAGLALVVDTTVLVGIAVICFMPTKATRERLNREQISRDRLISGRDRRPELQLLVDALVLRLSAEQVGQIVKAGDAQALIGRVFGDAGTGIWL